MADRDSVFHYYKKLISLRKREKVIVYGSYRLLEPDSESLYVYTRTLGDEKLLVICNFTENETAYEMPEEFAGGMVLIGNCRREGLEKEISLAPYEALVIKV